MDKKTIEEREQDLEDRRWQHRRRMAYLSIYTMICMTVAILVWDKPIIEPAFYAFASLVGAYMGFSTWASKK